MILIEEVKLHGKVIGLVAAGGKDYVGWSICNPIEKKFSLSRGIEIAIGRIEWSKKTKLSGVKRLYDILTAFIDERERTHSIKRTKELRNIIERFDKIFVQLKAMREKSLQKI